VNCNRYDAIVVGARVAGAATGMLLARAGLDVLVVDRARYGSDTMSTHALMRGGVLQLARWGLLDAVIEAGTPPVRRTVMRYGGGDEVIDIKPRPGYDALYAPRRTVLDRILVDAAFCAGADVRFGATVEAVTRDAAGHVDGIAISDRAGAASEVRAPIVIGADGVRSMVARAVEAPVTARAHHSSAFFLTWYSGVEADGYQWLYGHGADGSGRSAGIIPTNDDQVCAWVGVPSAMAGDRRPEDHLRQVLGEIAPDWRDRLAAGTRHGPVRGFAGLPGYLRRPWGHGWALVGDAGYFKDPLTAHGMTDALRDAELLARAIVAGAGDPVALAGALAEYEATRDLLSLPLFRLTDRVAGYDWSMPELRDLLLATSAAMRAEIAHLAELDIDDLDQVPAAV
jgi:flavin-dependent dehydrogenase